MSILVIGFIIGYVVLSVRTNIFNIVLLGFINDHDTRSDMMLALALYQMVVILQY
jgi:hypothetical protein